MWDPNTGKTRGYGFVSYSDRAVLFLYLKKIKEIRGRQRKTSSFLFFLFSLNVIQDAENAISRMNGFSHFASLLVLVQTHL